MKKTICMVLAVMLLCVLASCQNEIKQFQENPDCLVSVKFKPIINQTKSILSSVPDDGLVPATYQYKASPVSKNPMMRGQSADWLPLENKSQSGEEYETSKIFSVGQWKFSIRAFNENGGLIYQGESSEVILTENGSNVVEVGLAEKVNSETEDKGTVSVLIQTPHLVGGGEAGTLVLNFTTIGGETVTPEVEEAITSSESNGVLTFSGSYSLDPGLYLVKASYSETASSKTLSMYSSLVALRVVEKTTSLISGSIEESLYVSAVVSIGETKKVSGSMTVAKSGNNYTCTFTAASGSSYLKPTSYIWYEDAKPGVDAQISNNVAGGSSVYTFIPGSAYGYHSVTCIAVYSGTEGESVFSATKPVDVVQ